MTDREKIIKALAPLRASDTAVQEVLEMAEHRNTHTIKRSGRTLLIAAVVAVLLIGTALAVTYSAWSTGLQKMLRITDDELAALEQTDLMSRPLASDTHDGVTISVERSVSDGESAFIALRVEGFDIPEGRNPSWEGLELTLDGAPALSWGFSAFDGLTWDGQRFIYNDGTVAKQTEEGAPIPRYMREDGTVEFDLYIDPGDGDTSSLVGRTASLTISRLCTYPVTYGYVPEEERDCLDAGPWTLTWVIDGSDAQRSWTLNEPLGDTGITLSAVTLSPLSAHIQYDCPEAHYFEVDTVDPDGSHGTDVCIAEPPVLHQIVMKDGTIYSDVLGAGTAGPDVLDESELEDGFTYAVDMSLNHVIDPDEVAALVFRETAMGDDPGSEAEFYTVYLSG